ncbi:hypothetical protein C5S31_08455 [ANME-1 cluster archaeon GoMg2]|nr:hypothetical protein [ANME-1 cluster archaeon GoMg2]
MKHCAKWGTETKEEGRFCKKCGTALERSLSHLRNGCLGIYSDGGSAGALWNNEWIKNGKK